MSGEFDPQEDERTIGKRIAGAAVPLFFLALCVLVGAALFVYIWRK